MPSDRLLSCPSSAIRLTLCKPCCAVRWTWVGRTHVCIFNVYRIYRVHRIQYKRSLCVQSTIIDLQQFSQANAENRIGHNSSGSANGAMWSSVVMLSTPFSGERVVQNRRPKPIRIDFMLQHDFERTYKCIQYNNSSSSSTSYLYKRVRLCSLDWMTCRGNGAFACMWYVWH